MFQLLFKPPMESSSLSSGDTNAINSNSKAKSSSVDPSLCSRKPVKDSTKRLTRIFHELITNNENFKNLWLEVNRNAHQPTVIIPSPPVGDERYVAQANLQIKKTCPKDCPKGIGDKTASFPHSFKIHVNAEPFKTDDEIARAIIFETCNAFQSPKHLALDKEAEDSMIDMIGFAKKREQIEYEALILANKISATFVPSSKILPFKAHLELQKEGGHFQDCESQFIKIKEIKHRRSKSSS